MLKYKDIKDAMDMYRMQQQTKITVDKLFLLSVLEEVACYRRKAVAKSRQGGKISPPSK